MKIGITKSVQKEQLMELDANGLLALICSHVAKDAGSRIATLGMTSGGFITSEEKWDTLKVNFNAVLLNMSEFEELEHKARAYDEYIGHIHAPQSIKPVMAAMDHKVLFHLAHHVLSSGPIIESMSMMRNPIVPEILEVKVKSEPKTAPKGLRNLLKDNYNWLARDKNGTLTAYECKPFKIDEDYWNFEDGDAKCIKLDDNDYYLMSSITWFDVEPTKIESLISGDL